MFITKFVNDLNNLTEEELLKKYGTVGLPKLLKLFGLEMPDKVSKKQKQKYTGGQQVVLI